MGCYKPMSCVCLDNVAYNLDLFDNASYVHMKRLTVDLVIGLAATELRDTVETIEQLPRN